MAADKNLKNECVQTCLHASTRGIVLLRNIIYLKIKYGHIKLKTRKLYCGFFLLRWMLKKKPNAAFTQAGSIHFMEYK